MTANLEEKVKTYYDQFYAEKKEWLPLEAYYFFRYLKPRGRLLDVACGNGYFVMNAIKYGLECYGVDISSEAIKIADKLTNGKAKFYATPAEKLPFENNFFDYVTILGSLEHFMDKEKALNEVKRVLRRDGQVLITVPNANFWGYKITGKKGTEQQDAIETLYSLEGWKELLEKNGLKVLQVDDDNSILWKFKGLKKLGLKTIWKIVPFKYTYQFMFLCKKA